MLKDPVTFADPHLESLVPPVQSSRRGFMAAATTAMTAAIAVPSGNTRPLPVRRPGPRGRLAAPGGEEGPRTALSLRK